MLDEVRSKKAVIGMRRSIKLIESGMAAKAFIAFLLSREGQLLHCLKPGLPGGPGRKSAVWC